jgi:hypothetical protein
MEHRLWHVTHFSRITTLGIFLPLPASNRAWIFQPSADGLATRMAVHSQCESMGISALSTVTQL